MEIFNEQTSRGFGSKADVNQKTRADTKREKRKSTESFRKEKINFKPFS